MATQSAAMPPLPPPPPPSPSQTQPSSSHVSRPPDPLPPPTLQSADCRFFICKRTPGIVASTNQHQSHGEDGGGGGGCGGMTLSMSARIHFNYIEEEVKVEGAGGEQRNQFMQKDESERQRRTGAVKRFKSAVLQNDHMGASCENVPVDSSMGERVVVDERGRVCGSTIAFFPLIPPSLPRIRVSK